MSMMEPTIIKAFDLNVAWHRVVLEAFENGYERPVIRGAMNGHDRKELDYLFIYITNPENRPLAPEVPDGIPPPTSRNFIYGYLGDLMTPYKENLTDYTYGERITEDLSESMRHMLITDELEGTRVSGTIVDFSGVSVEKRNQIGIIMDYLKESPGTNRSVIAVGKSTDLFLDHPPCLRLMQYKERYGKLHVSLYFRSWDLWAGFPTNLGGIQLMSEYIAKEIGVETGTMFACSMGPHIYDTSWELAETLSKGGTGRRTIE